MSDIVSLILVATLIAAISALIWWLLIASEGVYLGRRVVIWLYDLYANRYDGIKNYFPEYEQMYLAEPLMDAIEPQTNPLVLDVATGTGRVPLALARHPDFDGHVIGADLSRRMLHYATRNIYPYNHRATFVWCPAEHLPFPDNTFDVVTCMEALEFMNQPEAVLKELIRALRPGGTLLVSQRVNTRLMPGKTWNSGKVIELLEQNGIEDAHAQVWQVDYRKVWGRKAGDSSAIGARTPYEVMLCPQCGKLGTLKAGDSSAIGARTPYEVMLCPQCGKLGTLKPAKNHWLCENCKIRIPVGEDEVLELHNVRSEV